MTDCSCPMQYVDFKNDY